MPVIRHMADTRTAQDYAIQDARPPEGPKPLTPNQESWNKALKTWLVYGA